MRDIALRALGVVLWVCCALVLSSLYHRLGTTRRDATLPELLAGIVGFFCFSAGNFLVILGQRIFDRVEVSERWAKRSYTRPDEFSTDRKGQTAR